MIQLSFQPAFDPFHAVYRALRLFPIIRQRGFLHRDQVRILDYYMLFPHRLSEIRLIRKHRRFKDLAARYEAGKPYGEQPDDRTLFERMEPMQIAALQTLAKQGLMNSDELAVGLVKLTDSPIPSELGERISAANREDAGLIEFLCALATDLPLSGPHGLKARTGLLEYRYDAV
jgi:hypothetical protein